LLKHRGGPQQTKTLAINRKTTHMPTPSEFANIVACERCTVATSQKLLRDELENVPQPGFVGSNYKNKRAVLAGQNPGICPPRFTERDAVYTAALRAVRDEPNAKTMKDLNQVLSRFVPEWPVHGNYFPLAECGLTLNDIAYFNVVRCRTQNNSAPGKQVITNCLHHFSHWVGTLQPQVVVFIGKWAFDKAGHIPNQLGIPCDYMNRERSLSGAERIENRNRVVAIVRNVVG
jgi:hypothetical protein